MIRSGIAAAALLTCVPFLSGCSGDTATAGASTEPCLPGAHCETPLPVKFVVIAMFEKGEMEGDAPGEFQLWKERRGLDQKFDMPHADYDLYYNAETQVLGFVTGIGTAKSSAATMALGLDQRFDLTKAYWMVAGIAGIDPEDASIGSVAWSSYLVDGDLAHEIDPREIPEDWEVGYFARRTQYPFGPRTTQSQGEIYVTNIALRDWAYDLTKDLDLGAWEELEEERAQFINYPNAQKPPFVLKGGHIAAMTFWHGKMMNDWANKWVHYWSDGATDFVTSAMEDTGTFQSISYLHELGRVDKARFLVLRGGSNYTMPPAGKGAAEYLLRENEGYVGMEASLESIYTVGSKVLDEILGNWDEYEAAPPGGAPTYGE